MKVAIVQSVLAPYRVDLFNELSLTEAMRLKVLICFKKQEGEAWAFDAPKDSHKFDMELLDLRMIRLGGRTIHPAAGLYRALQREMPAVVVSGSLSASTLAALLYGRRRNVPVVVWWAGTRLTERPAGRTTSLLRRLMISNVDAFIAYSTAAADYLEDMGAARARVHVAGNLTFDATKYRALVEQRRERARQMRASMGLSERPLLLCVGQLIGRKNHRFALDLLAQLKRGGIDAGLLLVGDGPERSNLERYAAHLQLAGVCFVGAKGPAELPLYYAMADIFIHPTNGDHWSQVVNEAMSCALPVVVSHRDHAVELIEHGVNGFKIDTNETREAVQVVEQLIKLPDVARETGQRGWQTAVQNDVHHAAAVFRKAIVAALDSRQSWPG